MIQIDSSLGVTVLTFWIPNKWLKLHYFNNNNNDDNITVSYITKVLALGTSISLSVLHHCLSCITAIILSAEYKFLIFVIWH